MNKILEKQLAEVFEQDYQGYDIFVENVINRVFTGDDTFEALPVPEDILDDTNRNAATNAGILQILKIGSIDAIEGIDVYDITLRDNKQLQYNRVGIQQLIRSQQIFYSNAFLLFHNEHPEGKEWRFSYFYKEGTTKSATSAKRYTYLFGKGRGARTAIERFSILTDEEKSSKNLLKAFSVEALTQEFYHKLYNWYLWAIDDRTGVTFPNRTETEIDDRDDIQRKMIRLITRLMFVWFIKQKHLVPEYLFDETFLKDNVLCDFNPQALDNGNYYNAILQNLFFATLNQEISERKFISDKQYQGKSESYTVKNLYRDNKKKSFFRFQKTEKEQRVIELFKSIPYLNGGLFECLDKYEYDPQRKKLVPQTYYDGFSSKDSRSPNGNLKYRAFIPNALFFAPEHKEMVKISDQESQEVLVSGLIEIFRQYNFTVEENTTSDAEVSLDPELLGKVFENLLAAYNPETKDAARKATGSYYTPREIVDYMVNESLKAYLTEKCGHRIETIQALFEDNYVDQQPDTASLIAKDLRQIKVLDPACGSGAFPMGMLLRITTILERLEPNGFNKYQTKLDIIKNCIYGIDIQPIAMLICKLRFFISLICDNDYDPKKENFGIIPLPNLETKFIAANSLVPAKVREFDNDWTQDAHLIELKEHLLQLRKQMLDLHTRQEKITNRKADLQKCQEIRDYIWQNVSKPDQEKIARLMRVINDCQAELPHYMSECWRDETELQTSLFDMDEPTLFRKDINKAKRIELQERIKACQADIDKERNKAVPQGFEKAVEEVTMWNPYDQNSEAHFFDAEWMFGIGIRRPSEQGIALTGNSGFDIVIGNPPYISHDNISNDIPSKDFACFEPFADLYCYFFDFGIHSLATNGVLSYVTSNSFLRANYGLPLRKLVLKKCSILKIIDIEGTQVFNSAIVNTAITFLKRQTKDDIAIVVNAEWQAGNIDEFVKTNGFCYQQQDFNLQPWTLINPKYLHIRSKIENAGPTLMSLKTKIRLGLATGDNNAFIINEDRRQKLLAQDMRNEEIIKPIIRGQDIQSYSHAAPQYVLLTKNGINVEEEYPTVYKYLDSFGEKFKHRGAKGKHWSNLRACAFFEDFKKEKIIWIELTDKGRFSLSDKEEYLLNSAYFLIPPESVNIKYLLGILNSSVVRFYIRQIAATSGMGTLRWINNYVKLIPIPLPTDDQQSAIISYVNAILEKKQRDVANETITEEYKLDQAIYNLYNLTEEDIKLIEQAN